MITLLVNISSATEISYDLTLMRTAWSKAKLMRWASAVNDLLFKSNEEFGRSRPRWYGYRQRNIPVLNL